jgi:hypothetical protein
MKNKKTSEIIGNAEFKIAVNPDNGSIEKLILEKDPEQMNWVLNSTDNPWHLSSMNWGLGYLNLAPKHKPYAGLVRWESPSEISISNKCMDVRYENALFSVNIHRSFYPDNCFAEKYEISNKADAGLDIYNLAIYAPFNDNYPDAKICVSRRCNAHIWCGGDVTWVNALRMGGAAPHLGLITRQGSFSEYEISERRIIGNSSNTRGAIGLLADLKTIPVGGKHCIEWIIFPHNGIDFKEKAQDIIKFPLPEAEQYTVTAGEKVRISMDGVGNADSLSLRFKDENIPISSGLGRLEAVWAPSVCGEHKLTLSNPEKTTFLNIQVIDSVVERIRKRADFIVNNQQVNDAGSDMDGAFLIYDNEIKKTYCAKGDYNEGRERVGMGVLLAMVQREYPADHYKKALLKYYKFVRFKLQTPDAMVQNGVNDKHHRLYNYPWAAWFHLEMYLTLGDRKYLADAFDTLRAFYSFGHEFYAINIQVVKMLSVLAGAGMEKERKELFEHFLAQGDYIIRRGIDYPSHEVVYEQSIVGPAVQFLLELFLVTKDNRYLEAVSPHLRCLEAFNGKQPDFHLNEIAIRHWDGWWFGKRPRWGDTFPHYWSTITANAFHRYWQATGDLSYLKRAKMIVMNNLCLFSADGHASCAYLYPILVDGELGRYYDPYANDQDWALVHYLDIAPDFTCLTV